MSYQVQIARAAQKALAAIDRRQRERIEDQITALGDEPRPHGAIKLSGVDAYRIRIGDYRVVYTIDDAVRVVSVTNIGNRGSIYRRM